MTVNSDPDVVDGIEYWTTQPASNDGVLGGYGLGSLPRIDSLGSRLFLLDLYPDLSTVPSSRRSLTSSNPPTRTRALDVGAGIGRVTADVLLYLVSDVVLLEPVDPFVQEALARARSSTINSDLPRGHPSWPGIADQTKSIGAGFDVIWCQWCLGHLNDRDLVAFFRRSHDALRGKAGKGLIVVKENICQDREDGTGESIFDEQDSSLTRSDLAWKDIFKQAGLKLVKEKVQEGLPEGLYVVKMYGLR
ncbi:uncharacterized protein LACBIDRAFT_182129 [Laccaria bicolor S238N-H82]|uniref:Alpha N-terminal protein methyltransferase 1 n=1 Tax=Laccaria bicolor (strain S238N-H82 / ATCC MYA-4686) TaxID=486041 RepID=B0CSJ4_LACBS|nr:uncharacterized protein LACBIDRAFT_182129 [Laccaria bicolor S238N-H82]EDR14319.1 predicted protein [Laccaria bicolor S238N-H82]|eukprot:XP_001874878.1 predicted protein [Laccaria bicolor S238N-H82]